jgi:hypothetical protein
MPASAMRLVNLNFCRNEEQGGRFQLNDKKNPHIMGEDRDGVYGKENRVYYWGCTVLLLLDSMVAEPFASLQPRATDPFVAGV